MFFFNTYKSGYYHIVIPVGKSTYFKTWTWDYHVVIPLSDPFGAYGMRRVYRVTSQYS